MKFFCCFLPTVAEVVLGFCNLGPVWQVCSCLGVFGRFALTSDGYHKGIVEDARQMEPNASAADDCTKQEFF